jgi:uncharacterized membrane protein YkvA (DUF1232 family)
MANQKESVNGRVGLLADMMRSGKLAWQLLKDPRVSMAYKLLIPGLAGLYLLFPADLLPDFFPVLGQLDDLALIVLAIKLFIQLVPVEIVNEYRTGQVPAGGKSKVVDGDYRVMD